MKLTTLPIICLLCLLLRFDVTSSTPIDQDERNFLSEEERQILVDCENSDYRAYIKCIKRHKRHPLQTGSKDCFDDCFKSNCTTLTCKNDCYVRCKKRIRHEEIVSKITELEIDHSDKSAEPNITAVVNLNNTFNFNATEVLDVLNKIKPQIQINNVINNDKKEKPEYPNVPNVFSFSMSLAGYGPVMPVMPFFPHFQPVEHMDCSFCGTVMFRYRCSISCINETQTEKSTMKVDSSSSPITHKCYSPECIGGTNKT